MQGAGARLWLRPSTACRPETDGVKSGWHEREEWTGMNIGEKGGRYAGVRKSFGE